MTQEPSPLPVQTTMDRFEQKLIIRPHLRDFVVAWLRHYCVPDPVYPLSLVTSLYFDTSEFDSYYECLSGDTYKNKFRLRWYDNEVTTTRDIPAYIELKSKMGFNTIKRRKQIIVSGSLLRDGNVTNLVSQLELDRSLQELGYLPQKQLRPLVVITYRRFRFRERQRGISVTYDFGISSFMVDRNLATFAPRLELETTVLELKGGTMEFPSTLQGLQKIAPQWNAFSKYALCLNSHFEQPGSVGWLKL